MKCLGKVRDIGNQIFVDTLKCHFKMALSTVQIFKKFWLAGDFPMKIKHLVDFNGFICTLNVKKLKSMVTVSHLTLNKQEKFITRKKNTFLNWNYQFSLHEGAEKSGKFEIRFSWTPCYCIWAWHSERFGLFGLCPLVT